MANQIDRDAFVTRDVLKNPISYVRGTDLIPIVIHFRDFQIPIGATARVFVAKSDGNAVYTTATIDGNDVTIDVQGQMFIELGTALMQISIMDGDEELCTFVQPVNVEPNLKAGDFPASGNDITFLDDAIEQANQAVNTATTAAQKASAAVQNANTAISNANKAISDLNAQIATLENNFASLAQTVEISQLQTVAKTLAGAVNELNSKSYLLQGGTAITADADLNDYALPGSYYCRDIPTAQSIQNSPFKDTPYTLKVEYGAGTYAPCQTARNVYTGQIAYRNRGTSGTTWSGWEYSSLDNSIANVLFTAQAEYNGDCNDLTQPGLCKNIITPSNGHSPGFYAYILVLKGINYEGTQSHFTQVAFPYNSSNQIVTRHGSGSTWSEWA